MVPPATRLADMTSIQCIILAGGLGTRLRQVVNDQPKALAEIGRKPFLYYQISFLARYGIKEIVLCTGHLGHMIRDYIQKERNGCEDLFKNMDIKFSDEGDLLLGTGGALKRAKHLLDDRFFLLNGDTLFLSDLNEIVKNHFGAFSDITIGLTEVNDSKRYGTVNLQDQKRKLSRILSFSEKEETNTQIEKLSVISAGLYLIEKMSIDWQALPEKFSLEKDLLPVMVAEKRAFGYLDSRAYFIDMGTPEGYNRLREDVSKDKIPV